MSVARGTKYLQETKLRQQEGKRLRTEASIVQLKLTEFETRTAHLERLSVEFEGKTTARSLPFCSAILSTSLLFCLFLLLAFYVFTSSLRGPTFDKN